MKAGGILASGLSVVVLVAGLSGQQAPTVFSDADRAAIRAALAKSSQALNMKDAAGWAAVYAEDAVALHPTGDKIEGRAALQKWLSAGAAASKYETRVTEMEGRADLAYIRGAYSMFIALPGRPAPVKETGEFIQIWRKHRDGVWQISREMFSSDLLKWPQ